jgi:hypothetical protein
MKQFFKAVCILQFTTFFMIGCKKNTVDSLQGLNHNNTPNFYLAGQSDGKPCLWINNTKNILSAFNGIASQILINGNDIYVTGYYLLPDKSADMNRPRGLLPLQYVYWKNGIENKIGNVTYRMVPEEPTISIVGNNIFYANGQAWENGSLLNSDLLNSAWVEKTTSYGPNIYFVGTDSSGKAVYWENGLQKDIITNETRAISAYSLAVSSNNVYVGGEDSNSVATIWINGMPENLHSSIPGSYAVSVSSLFANGTDIYAIASLQAPTSVTNGSYTNFDNIPVYWKNGIEHDLPLNGDSYGSANTVFVNGSDIYVCGNTASGAVYWKNGIETKLGSDYGAVSYILIK